MSNVKIELNRAGVSELLKRESLPVVQRIAEHIAARAAQSGGRYEVDAKLLRNRASAMVWTADFEAMENEATNRTLSSAIDAGRI